MKSILITKTVLTIVLLLSSFLLKSQDISKLDQKPWSFNLNFGQTLFWGDGNNDILNPFGAYFKNDKSAFGYGLIVQKNFNSWLGVDFQYLGGQLKGTRYTWSNEVPANLYFMSNINQFGLNMNIDVFDLFMKDQPTRLFNFYVRGGGAYNMFDATEYNLLTDAVVSNVKDGAIDLVGGWGIRFDLSKSMGITFENIFAYSLSDYLDAHSTEYSTANDLFAYTSLGFTYRIYPKAKKPRLDTEPEVIPENTGIAVTEEPIDEPEPELSVKFIANNSIKSSDTTLVRIKIYKYDLDETAKIQQTLPLGFYAVEKESGTASFSFSDQIVSFNWDKFPSQKENIEISYYLISDNIDAGNYGLPGIIFYNKKGEENISQFKESITVTKPKPVVVATTEPVVVPAEQPSKVNQQTPVEGLEYRVQVKAIYGGKSTPESIARQYSIDKNINEEFTNGYAKYTAGSFTSYAKAQAYKNQLRSGKVPGAFVVAYYNGNRINNITEAIKMERNGPTSSSKTTPTTMKQEGVSFSIQVAASSRELSPTSIKNQFGLEENVIMTMHNGLYKYVIGSFDSYSEATATLNSIRTKVSDAFLVKYVNGVRK